MAALPTTPGVKELFTEKEQKSAQLVHTPSQVNCDKEEKMKYAHFFQEDEPDRSRLMIKNMREELLCLKEITALETKFENWRIEVKPSHIAPSAPKPEIKVQEKKLPADIRALDTFLKKTGGLNGGWEEYEHEDFVRTWRKHSGKTSYTEEVKLYLPERKLEDILLHEDWYKKLLYLQEKKRAAVERWKAHKQQGHQIRIQMEKEELKKLELKRREEKLKTKNEVAIQRENWRQKKDEKERNERNEREKNEEYERHQEKKKRRLQLKVKRNIKQQLQLRKKVEKEEARIKKEAEEKEMTERRRQAAKAAKAIKCSTERDLEKVREKLQEKQLREKEEEGRRKENAAKLKEKVDSQVTRDPSRLFRPTKGWEERLKNSGLSAEALVQRMYRRRIPTWKPGQW